MIFFITGGTRGIGAGIARGVLSAGHDLAFSYVERADLAAELVAGAAISAPGQRCRAYQLDVRDPAAVERVIDQLLEDFGTVDVAVLSAAINRPGLAISLSDEDWRDVIDASLSGAFYVCRQLLPAFLANGRGRFIHISSIAMYGMVGLCAYSAAKAGLCGFSASLSKEYGRKGITSNVLTLGFFDTDMTRELLSEKQKADWQEKCPAGRQGQDSDVVQAVLYLASDGASFVSGETLHLTGGVRWAI
jgi:NAD(P)-dependent dehydrogenase (short-subunit alcohol dehydrogenase family)